MTGWGPSSRNVPDGRLLATGGSAPYSVNLTTDEGYFSNLGGSDRVGVHRYIVSIF